MVADSHISFEHLVFLVGALAAGEELALSGCEDRGALTVVDRITFKAHRCPYCASRANCDPGVRRSGRGIALAQNDIRIPTRYASPS